jgi:1-deoxyxylulose-5-phosphate synthase
MGTGSDSGNIQRGLGRDGFNRLVRHAYDQGITHFDTADAYQTHEWIRDAVKGLPREKLFIQTKIGGAPEKPIEVVDRFRKELNTDYIDSVLIHCTFKTGWDQERKRVMDGLAEAEDRKWIRAHGVSCHSLPALELATKLDWVQVHLVRVNPQGAHVDTLEQHWEAPSKPDHLPPVLDQIHAMHAKGRGIIGMKIMGNGDFTNPEDREKSIQFAMAQKEIDAIVIGFKSPGEIDEAIERMNRALA